MSEYKDMVLKAGVYCQERDVLSTISIHGDEYYTLPQHVKDIASVLALPKNELIWCPFDTDGSQFPKILRAEGWNVVNTSTDFFVTPPPAGTKAIISNPPFSRKKDVLKRIDELNIPFVLILPLLWLNDGIPFDYGHQMIMWRKRVYFTTPNGTKNKARTTCFVLSNGLLKADLTIYHDR